MGRPKQKKRFTLYKISPAYWVLSDDSKMVGYISRGSGRKVYFCNSSHQLLADGYTSMRLAADDFISRLSTAEQSTTIDRAIS